MAERLTVILTLLVMVNDDAHQLVAERLGERLMPIALAVRQTCGAQAEVRVAAVSGLLTIDDKDFLRWRKRVPAA